MYKYLQIGGPIMWLLFLLSVISLAVIIERIYFFLKNEKQLSMDFKQKINNLIINDDINGAIELCNKTKGTVSSAIRTFLKRSNKEKNIEEYNTIIKEITLEVMTPFEKRLSILEIIGSIAPMLGLLGTVTGMITAFLSIAQHGSGDSSVVAGGISEALFTTAAGLIIAIPCIITYNILIKTIERSENEIDKIVANIINIFRR